MLYKKFLDHKSGNNKNVFFISQLKYSTALTKKTNVIIKFTHINKTSRRNFGKVLGPIADFLEGFLRRFPTIKVTLEIIPSENIFKKTVRKIPPPGEVKEALKNCTQISKVIVTDVSKTKFFFFETSGIKTITSQEFANLAATVTFGGVILYNVKPTIISCKSTIYDFFYNPKKNYEVVEAKFQEIQKFIWEQNPASKYYDEKYSKLEYIRLLHEYLYLLNKYQNSYLFSNCYSFLGYDIVRQRQISLRNILSANQTFIEESNLPEHHKTIFLDALTEKKLLIILPDIQETVMITRPDACISKTPLFFIEG